MSLTREKSYITTDYSEEGSSSNAGSECESDSEFGSDLSSDLCLDSDLDSDYQYYLSAQQQWEESIDQMTKLIHLVLFPLLGKFVGRKMAMYIWGSVAERLF